MLSGIRTGKRKRPAPPAKAGADRGASRSAATAVEAEGAVAGGGGGSGGGNRSAAEALRRSLLDGGGRHERHERNERVERSDVQARLDALASSRGKKDGSALDGLQRRGRIAGAAVAADDAALIAIGPPPGGGGKSTLRYEHEQGVRYNARGKLSRHAHDKLRERTDREMTVAEMAAQERRSSGSGGMDETYARNVLRMGKGYKKLDAMMGTNSRSGADEEDSHEAAAISNLYRSRDDTLSPAEVAARSRSRQVARHDAISKWTARSKWWMESPRFERRYLIALGEKVSLVMTPPHEGLRQSSPKEGGWGGGQCRIVPLAYAESFVGLDEDAWREVQRFQASLRRMFESEGRGVIFLETVARASRGGGGGAALQAKMEVVPVPRSAERDAPLYFRSALAEVAQEWGTHSKPIPLNDKKTLRNAVPKGFPYFYCGWDGGGCVLPIENEDDGDEEDGGGGLRAGGGSKKFPRDFGVDTIGGMLGCDPVRFQRRTPARDGDRAEILRFCDKWKGFDWTLELDG